MIREHTRTQPDETFPCSTNDAQMNQMIAAMWKAAAVLLRCDAGQGGVISLAVASCAIWMERGYRVIEGESESYFVLRCLLALRALVTCGTLGHESPHAGRLHNARQQANLMQRF